MDPKERHATLMIDEIQLTPGLAYDASSGTVFGAPTVPLADGTLPDGCLATHAIVFMLGGVSTRWKQVVAYHLTGNSFHAKTMKQIIVDVITECEKSWNPFACCCDGHGGRQPVSLEVVRNCSWKAQQAESFMCSPV